MTRLRFAHAITALVVLVALAVPTAEAVTAQSTTASSLRIEVPEQITQGQETTIAAVLEDRRGRPIQGAVIGFSERIRFFGYADTAPIGEARTDFRGRASLTHVPTTTGTGQLIAEFLGNEALAPASASSSIVIGAAPPATEAVATPPAEASLLPRGVTAIWFVVLLVGVWAAIGTAVYNVVRIPGERRRSADASGPASSTQHPSGTGHTDRVPAVGGAPPSGP
jgi:hypothetical protein